MLSIIIPALNEEDRIQDSFHEARAAAVCSGMPFEIILVDDGSSDLTWEKMRALEEGFPDVSIIKNITNLGLGASYKAGLKQATGNYVTWVPGDLSHKRDSLRDAYSAIGVADMVIPLPTNPEVRSIKRRVISKLYTFLINTSTGFDVPYYNGLTIHKRDLLNGIQIQTSGFGFQAEIITKLLKRGSTYVVVPTMIDERQQGNTKAFTKKNIIEVTRTLLRIFKGQ